MRDKTLKLMDMSLVVIIVHKIFLLHPILDNDVDNIHMRKLIRLLKQSLKTNSENSENLWYTF